MKRKRLGPDNNDTVTVEHMKCVREHLVDKIWDLFSKQNGVEGVIGTLRSWMNNPLPDQCKYRGQNNFPALNDVYCFEDAEHLRCHNIDVILTTYCTMTETQMHSEDDMHFPIGVLTQGLLANLFSNYAVKRNKKTTVSSSNYRPDEIVVWNNKEVFVQEEKHIDNYSKDNQDPVFDLTSKAPWKEWSKYFGELRMRPCIAVIGHQFKLDFNFGLLCLDGAKFESVHLQEVDLTQIESRLSFFVIFSKFMFWIGAFATCLDKSEVWQHWTYSRPGRNVSSVIHEGSTAVRKQWTFSTEQDQQNFYSNLRSITAILNNETMEIFWCRTLRVSLDTPCSGAFVVSTLVVPCGNMTSSGSARQPITIADVRDAMECVCDAIRELHNRRVVHNDIRWPNIVQFEKRWILIDFDDAAIMDGEGNVPGRPHLQVLNHAPSIRDTHDAHVDIWSLAHLLTNNCPVIMPENVRSAAYDLKREFSQKTVDDVIEVLCLIPSSV